MLRRSDIGENSAVDHINLIVLSLVFVFSTFVSFDSTFADRDRTGRGAVDGI